MSERKVSLPPGAAQGAAPPPPLVGDTRRRSRFPSHARPSQPASPDAEVKLAAYAKEFLKPGRRFTAVNGVPRYAVHLEVQASG
jgi:hypothetical protein